MGFYLNFLWIYTSQLSTTKSAWINESPTSYATQPAIDTVNYFRKNFYGYLKSIQKFAMIPARLQ